MSNKKHNRKVILTQCYSINRASANDNLSEVRKIGRQLAPELRWAYFNAPELLEYRDVKTAKKIVDQLFRANWV
jgi:hypothetical protein